jgi:serine/threonine protein kinase
MPRCSRPAVPPRTEVAAKIATDPLYIRQLQVEGVTIHRLRHPNIVRAINFDPFADPPYLIMEYVPGTDLRVPVRERRLSVQQALAVMHQLLSGLAYAHTRQVVHQDIKPENILVHQAAFKRSFDLPGAVKLTDFGLGRVTQSVNSILVSRSMVPDRNRSGGTPVYMARSNWKGARRMCGQTCTPAASCSSRC